MLDGSVLDVFCSIPPLHYSITPMPLAPCSLLPPLGVGRWAFGVRRSVFDVRCSAFDVILRRKGRSSISSPPPAVGIQRRSIAFSASVFELLIFVSSLPGPPTLTRTIVSFFKT
jgi:hypothetical protein